MSCGRILAFSTFKMPKVTLPPNSKVFASKLKRWFSFPAFLFLLMSSKDITISPRPCAQCQSSRRSRQSSPSTSISPRSAWMCSTEQVRAITLVYLFFIHLIGLERVCGLEQELATGNLSLVPFSPFPHFRSRRVRWVREEYFDEAHAYPQWGNVQQGEQNPLIDASLCYRSTCPGLASLLVLPLLLLLIGVASAFRKCCALDWCGGEDFEQLDYAQGLYNKDCIITIDLSSNPHAIGSAPPPSIWQRVGVCCFSLPSRHSWHRD